MRERVQKTIAGFIFMLAAALLFAHPVRATVARTVEAPSYSLKDVRKAEKPEGKWVKLKNGVKFKLTSTGKTVKSRWINVNGKIYYMDSKGWRVTIGFVKYRGSTYYMNKYGVLYTGWLTPEKKLCYFKANGKMVTGLKTIDGKTYYFKKSNGVRKTGWYTIGSSTYYFSKKDGAMLTSTWVKKGKKYYYLGEDGKMKKSSWITYKGNKYYVDETGARVTGTYYIGNNLDSNGYYFKSNGVYDPSVKVKPQIDTSKPMVALTFDDGPGAYTARLLNCLEKYNAKATFFMVGSNVSRYKSAVQKMVSLGCELGNHSWDHSYMTSLSASARSAQVTNTNNAIYNACGQYPTLFRLPYGSGHNNSSVLSSLGLPSIYWSIDTRDWANTGNPQHTVNAVLNNVKSGDIILMHDIHSSTVTAAETIIPALINRGYQLVTVSQLAKYKGKTTLKTGKTYYNFY